MDIDVTLLFQLGLLIVLMGILNRTLFAPLLKVIESRHQQIHGAQAEVERLERLSDADREAYEGRIREVRKQAHGEREKLRQEGREAARKLLEEARQRMSQELNRSRDAIHADERAARTSLDREVDGMAQGLVEKLLGRKVTV
jgi:F0F1-type ATP synthase membrane subunit b/b'